MGKSGAASVGMEEAPVPLEVGITGIIKQIDTATREETSGNFVDYNGDIVPW